MTEHFEQSHSPKKTRKAATIGIAMFAMAASGCTNAEAVPDGTITDATKLCLMDGARLRTSPDVMNNQGDGGQLIVTVDLDGNRDNDSGEAVCIPVDGVKFSKDFANGEWYQLNADHVSNKVVAGEVTLPDGHEAPIIFRNTLGAAASEVGEDKKAWVNSQRVILLDKGGKPLRSA